MHNFSKRIRAVEEKIESLLPKYRLTQWQAIQDLSQETLESLISSYDIEHKQRNLTEEESAARQIYAGVVARYMKDWLHPVPFRCEINEFVIRHAVIRAASKFLLPEELLCIHEAFDAREEGRLLDRTEAAALRVFERHHRRLYRMATFGCVSAESDRLDCEKHTQKEN
jgi:hypothetical protein